MYVNKIKNKNTNKYVWWGNYVCFYVIIPYFILNLHDDTY